MAPGSQGTTVAQRTEIQKLIAWPEELEGSYNAIGLQQMALAPWVPSSGRRFDGISVERAITDDCCKLDHHGLPTKCRRRLYLRGVYWSGGREL